jgi:hypothetical protein
MVPTEASSPSQHSSSNGGEEDQQVREWASKGEEVVQKMMSKHMIEDEEPVTVGMPSSGYMVPTEASSPSQHSSSNGGEEDQQVPIAPANASPYDDAKN